MIGAYYIQIMVSVFLEMYLGLRRRAEVLDRTLSQHLRHLIKIDLHQACAVALADSRGDGGTTERKKEP